MNLYKETINVLKANLKTKEDVLFINIKKQHYEKENEYITLTPNQFFEIAKQIEYDNGFGGVEIEENLQIIGKDFWLERHEYDGSEWWEFKEQPQQFKEFKEFDNNLIKNYILRRYY